MAFIVNTMAFIVNNCKRRCLEAKFMNRKPDSSAPKYKYCQGFQDIECQIVEADGLIRKLTDRDYYLPESSDVGMPDCPGCTFYAYELFGIYIGTIWVHESRASEISVTANYVPMAEFQAYLDGSRSCPTRLTREQAETMLYCNVQVVDVNEIALEYLHNGTYVKHSAEIRPL
jgi:hypothetical protein